MRQLHTSKNAWTLLLGLYRSQSQSQRSSGTITRAEQEIGKIMSEINQTMHRNTKNMKCGWRKQCRRDKGNDAEESEVGTDRIALKRTLGGIDGTKWEVFGGNRKLGQQVEESGLSCAEKIFTTGVQHSGKDVEQRYSTYLRWGDQRYPSSSGWRCDPAEDAQQARRRRQIPS